MERYCRFKYKVRRKYEYTSWWNLTQITIGILETYQTLLSTIGNSYTIEYKNEV